MEEEEPDYGTPIGKVIKHINTLCKKPQIDEQLGEALELFNKKLDEQEKYLMNGIFKINFSEAALFLQSSADLYGKKIDLLWDQLLEYHTRLIRYDCEHQKEKGGSYDKAVIEKLEERRNRYKRKKKFKLLLQPTETQKTVPFIFEKEVKSNPRDDYICEEDDKEQFKLWKDIEYKSKEMRKIPSIVYKQMTQSYMLKNYHILKSQDFEILDPEDDEFNTRYSRIPGWHHMLHLFEYNNKGLLPDKQNMIATLRLAAYKRIRFLVSRKIPLDTPFEEYKEEYMAYRKQYFEDEAKRWQNMPLDTLEDLHKQLQYLVHKDRLERGLPTTREDNIKLGRYGMAVSDTPESQESQEPTIIENIDLVNDSDDDSLFELSFSCSNEFTKSDLFVRLEKLSSDLINTKLRQDSGFFDFNSDSDNECDDSGAGGELSSGEINGGGANTSAGVGTDNTDVTGTGNSTNNDTVSMEAAGTSKDGESVEDNANGTGSVQDSANKEKNDNDGADFDDTRSYISDHDYCLSVPPLLQSDTNGDKAVADQVAGKVIDENENSKKIAENGNTKEITDQIKAPKQTVKEPVFAVPRAIPKVIKAAQKKEKKLNNNKTDDDQLLPKRRKLSHKQMEKLLQSKIKPVKELKFEKFFSMNYQPQLGEGEVLDIDYESGDSDTENFDEFPPHDDIPLPPRDDDTHSIMSDHDYCQPAAEDSHNDSGFIDTPTVSPILPNESVQSIQNNNTSAGTDAAQALEAQCQKLLAQLRESADESDPNARKTAAEIAAEIEQEEKEQKESKARVEEWRNSITPILRNLKENDFDIHEYGSRIMDNLEVNESRPFRNLVEGKASAEVVRYFISSLQLANTQNIEICGAQKGRLSNDTFEVKLLTKDRYHEHLSEYLAPSEETFREKLERVKAMNAANMRSSSGEPAAKKQKVTAAKGKRNKILNNVKKTTSNSPQHDNVHTVPSLSIEISKDKNMEYQLKKSQPQLIPEAPPNKEVVQDENNHSLNTYPTARSLAKGKSIVRRPVMSEKSPNTHSYDIDISMPSTSRQYYSPTHRTYHRSVAGDQTPSTSSSPDIELSPFNINYSPNLSISLDEVSPNKRRRDSNEDSFRERLIAVQRINPEVQMQSTPRGPPPAKQLKTSLSLQKSLLFK